MKQSAFLLAFCATLGCSVSFGQVQFERPEPLEPVVAPASKQALRAIAGFKLADGLRGELFAAEPDVANPVAIFVDNRGRVFVCESFRQDAGVTDNRKHDDAWLDDDLAAQNVADRLAYHRKHLQEKAFEYTEQDDRIRLLEDIDGDGRADKATVFANRFNGIVEGTGAGILVHGDDVFYTCIPNLWRLRDTDRDGRADARDSLHYGYGVRVAFRGHDLHGLIVGHDGRLYFSIGDRGYNVKTEDAHLVDPESGAVFRCNLDGSGLEVVHTGLRNPQELAFDDYGNLFTVDNNSDSGDQARLTCIVQGGDSGWRMSYQYLPDRGPFNRERIWHPFHPGQAAYIVPPIANITDGPSGLDYYPGTGLSQDFQGCFLICDFRGGPANSGIRSFRVKPKGAFFELGDTGQPIWNLLATDVQFGPDGAIYVSDWVTGWVGEGMGRIYRFFDPQTVNSRQAREVQALLAADFSDSNLQRDQASDQYPRLGVELLAHPDRRVRLKAQFALAARNDDLSQSRIKAAALESPNQLARLHALWAWEQRFRDRDQQDESAELIAALLADADDEVRAQAAKVVGQLQLQPLRGRLIELLDDASPRVRYFAAMSLGELGATEGVDLLAEMLAENNDVDPLLRHAGVMGLVGAKNEQLLARHFSHESPAVRRAIVVALRKLRANTVSRFLEDRDPQVRLEAARAVHDVPLSDAYPALAGLISQSIEDDALLRRVLNANFRLGRAEHAHALAQFASREGPSDMRIEALEMLAAWENPSDRDRVLGMWRPLPRRDRRVAAAALSEALPDIVRGPDDIRIRGAEVAAGFKIAKARETLRALLASNSSSGEIRVRALAALGKLGDDQITDLTLKALRDEHPAVRAEARRLLVQLDTEAGLDELQAAVTAETRIERQQALRVLASLEEDSRADQVLIAAMDQLIAERIAADTQLDVLEAARQRPSPRVQMKVAEYEAQSEPADALAGYRETLYGGNPATGREIFFERAQVSCVRCHKIGETGGDVGPDLSQSAREWRKLSEQQRREHVLESLVRPSQTIAEGYQTVVVITDQGRIITGISRGETEGELTLVDPEGKLIHVASDTIDELERSAKSAMPDDVIKHLTRFEIRDLVEYLSTLDPDSAAASGHESR